MDSKKDDPFPTISRLGYCEVCGANPAKYSCPQCEVKTCSLSCINIHKKELLCDGQRNKVKYIPLNKFTTMDMQNDYILLEEADRTMKRISSGKKMFSDNKFDSLKVFKLKKAARMRGIKLDFLPLMFSRHKSNTTYLNWKTGELHWKIQWVFPEADNYTVTDSRVLESCTLTAACSKHITKRNEDNSVEKLAIYQNAPENDIQIILKAEQVVGNKFYETDPENTLSCNLRGKIILEHPVFYVIFKKNLKDYEIESKVPDIVNKDKYFRSLNENKNFLFANGND